MDTEITFGQLMTLFEQQFPGLNINDMRPNGPPYELYVWLKNSPVNLRVTYNPEDKSFTVVTTTAKWTFLDS